MARGGPLDVEAGAVAGLRLIALTLRRAAGRSRRARSGDDARRCSAAAVGGSDTARERQLTSLARDTAVRRFAPPSRVAPRIDTARVAHLLRKALAVGAYADYAIRFERTVARVTATQRAGRGVPVARARLDAGAAEAARRVWRIASLRASDALARTGEHDRDRDDAVYFDEHGALGHDGAGEIAQADSYGDGLVAEFLELGDALALDEIVAQGGFHLRGAQCSVAAGQRRVDAGVFDDGHEVGPHVHVDREARAF